MLQKVLVANRGEIACRILRTLRQLGIPSVAIYSEADRHAPHVDLADEARLIGESAVERSYLNADRILEVAEELGVDGVHPGYGLLSENASFSSRCEAQGVRFIGPTATQMEQFALKHRARELAAQAGVPLPPGSGLLEDLESAKEAAAKIGYPVMLKSSAGGGGIGMRVCRDEAELLDGYATVRRLGESNFGDGAIFLEKFVEAARHVEVQVFGDGEGRVVTLGERDCSAQRRNQKVVEESPAPGLSDACRKALHEAARRLAALVAYRSAGTVEFLLDAESEAFYFLEVNTRLQVEHGVTELVYGLDLVEWMVRLAGGDRGFLEGADELTPQGHAIEARVYAEDPALGFQPSAGLLTEVHFPEGLRCDHWIEAGTVVTANYDPLLAKVLTHGATREEAVDRLRLGLAETSIQGIETNRAYVQQVLEHPEFAAGGITTRFLDRFPYQSVALEVLRPGTLTTVQDSGRFGYWAVGVPPSGPMDGKAFALGNRLVGNAEDAAGLEITMNGPELLFREAACIALTGAEMEVSLEGEPIPFWQAVEVKAGSRLDIGGLKAHGCRAYLAVRGGLDVPKYLGSRSTFTLGQFGGHCGRALRLGDVLPIGEESAGEPNPLSSDEIPAYGKHWEIAVAYGPHGAPDFFEASYLDTFFETEWEVHYNSARTGIRLVGPKPGWTREDGGEAGLHPSNIHDNAYAIGAVDFTGDMPVLLAVDGPSLGGFVCPATVVRDELWKLGQLNAGDTIRFRRLPGEAVLARLDDERDPNAALVCRRSGDENLLIEFGPPVLDLDLRFRAHAMMMWLEKRQVPGILELTPGIRSLQVHFDPSLTDFEALIAILEDARAAIGSVEDLEVETRVVHLPLSWDDPSTRLAIEKYMTTVRPDAPWCPSNLEFIRRINGLDSIEEVKEIVFGARYLVMGLGDVYLGAPVATPIDPRHRLVTTKYNPARTWTPENAVGIGGAYLCVYGMEGPGGYQFVGRTVQMWNRYRQTAEFAAGKPWLLRFFDQLRFYPVSEEELAEMREDFVRGKFTLKVERERFRLAEFREFLAENATSIDAFKQRQSEAFAEERRRWEEAGQDVIGDEIDLMPESESLDAPEGCEAVPAKMAGNVWKLLVEEGEVVEVDQVVAILEAMKMEVQVHTPVAGRVERVLAREGGSVQPGQEMMIIKVEA